MLNTDLNLARPDDIYEMLIDAHRGLTDGESRRLGAKLILLLVNHIGDEVLIREAIALARAGLEPSPRESGS